MLVRIMDIKKKMRRVWTKKGTAKFPECVNRFIEDHGYVYTPYIFRFVEETGANPLFSTSPYSFRV